MYTREDVGEIFYTFKKVVVIMETAGFIFLLYGLCSTHACSIHMMDNCEMTVNVYPYNILQHKNGIVLDKRSTKRGIFLRPIKTEKFNICKKE